MNDFEVFNRHVNEREVRLENYKVPDLHGKHVATLDDDLEESKKEIPYFRNFANFTEPYECTWAFMSKDEIAEIMKEERYECIKAILERKLCQSYPKGSPRSIVLDLLYSCVKFGKCSKFRGEQVAALLSIFYLTHRFFSISYTSTAEDCFNFFKEILTFHSLEYVPSHKLIFEPDEAHMVFNYFCKMYLRHLPIIRLLSLPNFSFELDLTVEPPPVFKKIKTKKDKKKKGKKGKRGKSK